MVPNIIIPVPGHINFNDIKFDDFDFDDFDFDDLMTSNLMTLILMTSILRVNSKISIHTGPEHEVGQTECYGKSESFGSLTDQCILTPWKN